MIFNSYEFIFIFLPITWALFYLIGRWNNSYARIWLLVASLFFYSYWNPVYLPLILSSMFVNFTIGTILARGLWEKFRKGILLLGIVFNVSLLGYFKYYDFFIETVNTMFGLSLPLKELVLPLAISFYTFQQIAYLVDSYRYETKSYNFFSYGLFVSFFPQLIAGPIVHHGKVMPQFRNASTYTIQSSNIAKGLLIFAIGLFKKVGIADQLALYASEGYRIVDKLTLLDSWLTTFAYTFQIYFDFSGYSDMAIGLGLLFNIALPVNFNSPLKATSIKDFWSRWHITLTQFLTKYVYIPLGGNRKNIQRTYVNIFLVFLISGIWHGAAWTFVIWGVMHGLASIVHRLWNSFGFQMSRLAGWFVTFSFIHLTFVMFRAKSVEDAFSVYKAMFGGNGVGSLEAILEMSRNPVTIALEKPIEFIVLIVVTVSVTFFARNAVQIMEHKKRTAGLAVFAGLLFFYGISHLQEVSEFLYFNF